MPRDAFFSRCARGRWRPDKNARPDGCGPLGLGRAQAFADAMSDGEQPERFKRREPPVYPQRGKIGAGVRARETPRIKMPRRACAGNDADSRRGAVIGNNLNRDGALAVA
jgi:hypothetical protein